MTSKSQLVVVGNNGCNQFGIESINIEQIVNLSQHKNYDGKDIQTIFCGDRYNIFANLELQQFWVAGNNAGGISFIYTVTK